MDRILIDGDSEILIGHGLPEPLLPRRAQREKVSVLTQPGAAGEVAADVVDRLVGSGLATELLELPDRDAAKELEVAGWVYDHLVTFNLGRHDTIVGVGGGAATDLSGFVAATWLRGVEAVMIPTTLLGAVDAAIGGKTGINRAGKNLIGAFWHPTRVIVDLDVLDRLPSDLLLEGTAEAIKAGFIVDPVIVTEYAERGIDARLDVVVPRAIAVKAEVVAHDFRESGRRAILNFGHTAGHAVEILTGLPHGFAVSIGMVAAAAISERRYGFDLRWLTDLLFTLGLPVAVTGMSTRSALDLIDRDKKRSSEGVRMVLLRAVGDPVVEPVTSDELELALSSIGAE